MLGNYLNYVYNNSNITYFNNSNYNVTGIDISTIYILGLVDLPSDMEKLFSTKNDHDMNLQYISGLFLPSLLPYADL